MGLIYFTRTTDPVVTSGNCFEVNGAHQTLGDLFSPNEEVIKLAKPTFMTYRDSFRCLSERRVGLYRYQTAKAILENQLLGDKSWGYSISLEFVEVEDGQELYNRIRSGRILPEVEDDWSQPQIEEPLPESKKPVIVSDDWWTRLCRFLSFSRVGANHMPR